MADQSFILRHFRYFCSCDLDPMTFTYKLDPYSLEICRMCKYKLPTSRILKVNVWHTYIHTDRQTDRHNRDCIPCHLVAGYKQSTCGRSYSCSNDSWRYWDWVMNAHMKTAHLDNNGVVSRCQCPRTAQLCLQNHLLNTCSHIHNSQNHLLNTCSHIHNSQDC